MQIVIALSFSFFRIIRNHHVARVKVDVKPRAWVYKERHSRNELRRFTSANCLYFGIPRNNEIEPHQSLRLFYF